MSVVCALTLIRDAIGGGRSRCHRTVLLGERFMSCN
jgi:hypothetical protein